MFRRTLENALNVRPGEGRLTALLFLHSFLAVGAFVAGRSVRDALFLANGGQGSLAWMYIASAAAVTLVGLGYNPLASQVRGDRLALYSALLFAGLFGGVFWLEYAQPSFWVYSVLYVYVEVMGALTMVQFWTLANELFHAREAKRLYGLIAAGGTLSNIAIGLLTGAMATRFGASAVLILCGALLLGCAGTSLASGRVGRQRLFARAATGRASAGQRTGGARRVFASAHLRTVALLCAVTFFSTTLVDFGFKVMAGQTLQKDQMVAYFGHFYAVVGVLALGLQLFGTSRVLARAGVIGALSVLPLSLIFGNAALILMPTLFASALAKGADALFRYSVNDATTQILYLPVPPTARAPAKAFIDSVVKPLSIGLAGAVLLLYRQWVGTAVQPIAWTAMVLSFFWLAVVLSLRSHYVRQLQDNLRQRRLDLDSARYRVQDGSTASVLVRALESENSREVLNALELLPHLEDLQLDQRVEPLLDHPLAEIRIAALEYYGRRQTMRFANSVFRRFEDPDPRIRAAAVNAFCTMGRDKAVRSVKGFLGDSDPAVRSAAITGMIRFGGLDGVLVAAEALKSLIAHEDAGMREHAAKILGDIGVKNFYQPVLELMNDREARVRRQAIMAAAKLRSPEFVIPLIYKMQSADTGREAMEALSTYEGQITSTLAKVLSNHLEEPSIRRGVARVLGRLATPQAVEVIIQHLQEPDEELRTRLYKSLARAIRAQPHLAADRRQVENALDLELQRACRALSAGAVLSLHGELPQAVRSGPRAADALLGSALEEKISRIEQRIFLLLSVLYPAAGMEYIWAGIRDAIPTEAARKRGNAVELLDNLLERSLKRKLLPLLEDAPKAHKLKELLEVVELPQSTAEQAVLELCQDETAWIRACAIYYACQQGHHTATELIVAAAADTSPVVRETALLACLTAAPERILGVAETRLSDDASVVRRQAARIAGRAG